MQLKYIFFSLGSFLQGVVENMYGFQVIGKERERERKDFLPLRQFYPSLHAEKRPFSSYSLPYIVKDIVQVNPLELGLSVKKNI